jgi:hypothetical protein
VEKGVIRQFVAMPLGAGYSVEEQLTGAAEHGGVQLLVHPLKREAYRPARYELRDIDGPPAMRCVWRRRLDMGLAPGGRMRQEIYDDPQRFSDWDTSHRGRCFIHLANALVWRAITGSTRPRCRPRLRSTRGPACRGSNTTAPTPVLGGGRHFAGVQSVHQLGKEKGDVPLPENQSVHPAHVVKLRAGLRPEEVREGVF